MDIRGAFYYSYRWLHVARLVMGMSTYIIHTFYNFRDFQIDK